ncbi:MAG: cytosine permease [Clostridia bacterium]|nr:cytosine permease [Clostridia bacterium]MBR3037643.1 cytosine permease [Clostridia bacterium]MBR3129760.1 cytosine permease [Clostridia bacterium]
MYSMEVKEKKQHVDIDYTFERVPDENRKGFWAMFVIMLGFTFFSASMWTGVTLANGLDFKGFILAVLLGGLFLAVYTGFLGFVGAKTGLNFDLLCRRVYGSEGSKLPSAMIALTQIGWTGVGFAMFAYPLADVFGWQGEGMIWLMTIIIGILITTSAYFGVKGLEIVSWVSVPLIAILGTYAMVKAAVDGGGFTAVFAKSAGNLTIIEGAGLVIGSFVSGGTATPNFTRFSKQKPAVVTTVIAFFIGNTLMFFFGGVAGAFTGQNDIFYVMAAMGLMLPAILVLGANIWTTNDNGLYTGGLGLSNIFSFIKIKGQPIRKRPWVLIAGVIAIVTAIWLYNNFCNWLNILNCTLPPIGALIIVDFFRYKKDYMRDDVKIKKVRWWRIIAEVLGSLTGMLFGGFLVPGFSWGIPAIFAMIVALVVYFIGEAVTGKKAEA